MATKDFSGLGESKHTRITPSQHEPHGVFMNNRLPRQIIGHCGPRIIAPITSGSCDDPPFYRGTSRHRRLALRATSPLLYPPGKREPAYLYGGFSSPRSDVGLGESETWRSSKVLRSDFLMTTKLSFCILRL
ncbi:hypothetical protein AVEN_42630-1 [Araneus ventricosus]|uniref:Uncharacterized protein n=1 Tax=Araneus ventricosus TaxID=182803 RepID=A0A4Y2BNI2_ARAVE|nr:hypothetical protein AVEN_42630-1 [Araneus ventricosus]